MHGCLVNIYGMGVVIVGITSLPTADTIIQLVKDGHQLIACSSYDVSLKGNKVIGRENKYNKKYLEAIGLDVVDVEKAYGVKSIAKETQIDLIIRCESSSRDKDVERKAGYDKVTEMFGKEIPLFTIPNASSH
jgi:HPr kinase/phosphorylase